MCAGGLRSRGLDREAETADRDAPGSHEEMQMLREQNMRLRRRQSSLERQLRELKELSSVEIQRHHEEEMAQRVVRHARETAACVMKHEEELRRTVTRYEEQLAAFTGGRAGAEAEAARKAAEVERQRAVEAECTREVAEAEAAKYKKKVQKLKTRRVEDQRAVREQLRRAAIGAGIREVSTLTKIAFLLWRRSSTQARTAAAAAGGRPAPAGRRAVELLEQSRSPRCLAARLFVASSARPLLSVLAALRSWVRVVAEARHEAELEAQLNEASAQTTAALYMLRADVRALRARGRRVAVAAADARALSRLAAPLAAWARQVGSRRQGARAPAAPAAGAAEAAAGATAAAAAALAGRAAASWAANARSRLTLLAAMRAWTTMAAEARYEAILQGQLQEANMQSMSALAGLRADVRVLRERARRVGVANANRRALASLAAPMAAWAREAAAARMARHRAQLNGGKVAEAQAAAAPAACRKAQALIVATRFEAMACRSEELLLRLTVLKAWASVANSTRHTTAMQRTREEAERRQQAAISCVRSESRAALQKAWSDAAEASRQAATLERRCTTAEASRAPGFGTAFSTVELSRCESRAAEARPSTAAAIERRLQLAEDEATRHRLATAARASQVCSRCSTGRLSRTAPGEAMLDRPELVGGAEVLRLPQGEEDEEDDDDEERSEEADLALPAFSSWQHLAADADRPVTPWRKVSAESARLMMCKAPEAAPAPTAWAGPGEAGRGVRVRALDTTLGRQARLEQAAVLGAWRRATLQARQVRDVETVQAKAWEHVQDVRRSRRQLFTAALEQQARYWQADAFATWRQRLLELRCKRPPPAPLKPERGLEALGATGSSGGTTRITSAGSTPRSARNLEQRCQAARAHLA